MSDRIADPAAMPPSPRLGADGAPLAFEDSAGQRALTAALAAQARRSILIYSPDLERPVYDDEDVLAALRRLAREAPAPAVRILVHEAENAVKSGHRLVETARRAVSGIQVRRAHSDFQGDTQAFLVADGRGIVHRPVAERHAGRASFNDPRRARELCQHFETVWARSEPDPDFRLLPL